MRMSREDTEGIGLDEKQDDRTVSYSRPKSSILHSKRPIFTRWMKRPKVSHLVR